MFSMVTLPPSRGGSRQASRQGGPRVGSSEEQKPSSSSGGGGGGVEGGPAAAPISPPVLPRLPSREGWVGGPSRSRSTSTLSMSSPLSPSRSSPLKKNSTGLDAGLRGSAGDAAGDGSDGGVDGGGSTTSDHSSQPSLDGGGGSFASLPSPSLFLSLRSLSLSLTHMHTGTPGEPRCFNHSRGVTALCRSKQPATHSMPGACSHRSSMRT